MAIGSPQWMYGSSGYSDDIDRDDNYYSYEVNNSLRIDGSSSASLSRTFSTGNRQTWSYSIWYKPSTLGGNSQRLLRTVGAGGWGVESAIFMESDGTIDWIFDYNGGNRYRLITEANFRDPAKWYHFLFVADTTNGTSNNRLRMYVNGERVDSFSTKNMPSQNYSGMINYAASHGIGDSTGYLDGHIAEVNFIDGTALPAAVFGEYGSYNDWRPIAYNTANGGYSTNGFYLKFANSSSLGTDSSGEGHNWTANNLSSTDQSIDSPTNSFATLNPLDFFGANRLEEGNLQIKDETTNHRANSGTMFSSSGKWYFEALVKTSLAGSTVAAGIGLQDNSQAVNYASGPDNYVYYCNNNSARLHFNGSGTGSRTLSTDGTHRAAAGDILQCAYDADTRKLFIGLNNSWIANDGDFDGNPATGANPTNTLPTDIDFLPYIGSYNNVTTVNFGQDSSFAGNKTAQGNQDWREQGDFYYEPPSGFLALCTSNMAKPSANPKENFNTVLWTGNGSGGRNITGVGFQPDFVWGKSRSHAVGHHVFDSVRGATKQMEPNGTNAESTQSTMLTAFISNGFTIGTDNAINGSGRTQVAWCWKAPTSSNLTAAGERSMATTSKVNVDAGFEIITYTGNGTAGAKIGHSLGVEPDLLIIRRRNASNTWTIYCPPSVDESKKIHLETSDAVVSNGTTLNSTAPTSTAITLGNDNRSNGNGDTYLIYAFAEKEGFSKFGAYEGTSDSDGPYIWTGFRPAWVMVKRVDNTHDWVIVDNKRGNNYEGWDGSISFLEANTSDTEDTDPCIDMLSSGFKVRDTALRYNNSGDTYLYIAFAETPFKYSNAR